MTPQHRPAPRATRVRRALLGAALGTLVVAGCNDVQGSGDQGYVTDNGQVSAVDPGDRGEPVTLEGEDLEGEDLSLEDFRGAPVVVNVWGSWCPPCRAEAPDLVDAANELEGRAAFVGINSRDNSPAQAIAFEETYEVPYPSFYSRDGRALLAFDGALGPRTIPATLVLDAEGRVAASIVGRVPSALTVVELVEDVLEESGR
ncbi:TlpA disulfide reductase family protein [Nocardioides zeae]|uniref:TlpA disulfide reductase family protein n=1 Tax=Nocardioides imazamoxiresistens TaxID=3231893 RepID=A0ABU3PZY1_9ACTN|nr:TlpA disulfide reductase family protein [Nocardioides zeae]MDT9594813.1 TlpA disulfide reductase family protein [Nocardioides zeae]